MIGNDYSFERAEILNLFSALFCQPEKEVVKNKMTYESLIGLLEKVQPDCLPGITHLQKVAQNYSDQDLLVEYARLFIGPFHIPAPPYSSMYFPEKTLMSNVTLWVMEMYKYAGLNFDKSTNDLPDHIVVETQFLYYLLFSITKELENQEHEKVERIYDLLQHFVESHFKIWVPAFCDSIIENTENGFYKNLSKCFKKFVSGWKLE